MKLSILVIDDDDAVRRSFQLALEDTDCKVVLVDSGEKGIQEETQNKFDLIFLDLKMPGLNGVETLKRLRKLDSVVPVYIVTAFHKEFMSELNEAVKEGLRFELISKPAGAHEIVSITNRVLVKQG